VSPAGPFGLRGVERALVLLGVFCVGWAIGSWSHAQWYQWQVISEFERSARPDVLQPAGSVVVPASARRTEAFIGVLGIPRLRLALAVLEGDDARTLDVAVGHLPDTALPWADGNTALAGHRDTFFRPLRHVAVGDDVHLDTQYGSFQYRVRHLAIVDADDLSVLSPSNHAGLTLITCYPFDYAGPAPRRFVVQAERLTGP
jgi:sortase A